jgi:hypothetical protein
VIVPQQSIDGVHLRMSAAGVRHVLGAPKTTRTIKHPTQGTIRLMDYGKTKVYLSATADGTVFSISTVDRRQRTRTGVGVGSSERVLKRGVKRVRCTGPKTLRSCTLGKQVVGRRVTHFLLVGNRIRQIALNIVIE